MHVMDIVHSVILSIRTEGEIYMYMYIHVHVMSGFSLGPFSVVLRHATLA